MGTHEKPKPKCGTCHGSKKITVGTNGGSQTLTCPTCWGTGTA